MLRIRGAKTFNVSQLTNSARRGDGTRGGAVCGARTNASVMRQVHAIQIHGVGYIKVRN